MEISFCALRQKTIVNVVDGKNLGHAQDILFEEDGNITGIIVPGNNSSFLGIMKSESIFIPWSKVCKLGDDVILVELANDNVFSSKSHDVDKNN